MTLTAISHSRQLMGLVLATWLVCAGWSCHRSGTESSIAAKELVLIDSKTGDVFQAPLGTAVPAKNPQTKKQNLVNAMYCEKCAKWYPVPPLEVLQRNPRARQCPKTGNPLKPTGPIPANARQVVAAP
jgi:hypothetical protein